MRCMRMTGGGLALDTRWIDDFGGGVGEASGKSAHGAREEALGERGPAEVEEGNYHKGRDAGTACIDKEVQE